MSFVPLQAGVPGGLELVVLLVMFLFLAVPVVISVLIYSDADKRNSRHALAWGIASFFGGLVVWLLYLVVQDEVGP